MLADFKADTVLVEAFSATGIVVDRGEGVIRGVKILSPRSVNPARLIGLSESQVGAAAGKPYRYSDECMREAAPLYEGAKVNVNHPPFEQNRDGSRAQKPTFARRVEDRFGELRNITAHEDGLRGDLFYLKAHPVAAAVAEAAERMPAAMALSHMARPAGFSVKGGEVVIDKIDKVFSVDLIAEKPGTNKTLFEGASALADLDALGLNGDDDSSTPSDALRKALNDSLCSIIGDESLSVSVMQDKLIAAVKTIGSAMAKLEGSSAGKATEAAFLAAGVEPTPLLVEAYSSFDDDAKRGEFLKALPKKQPAEKTPVAESSVEERIAALEARNQQLELRESARLACSEAGVETDDVIIEAYSALPVDKRKAFLDKLPKKAPAAGRKVRSGVQVIESFGGSAEEEKIEPCKDAKEFALALTGGR